MERYIDLAVRNSRGVKELTDSGELESTIGFLCLKYGINPKKIVEQMENEIRQERYL